MNRLALVAAVLALASPAAARPLTTADLNDDAVKALIRLTVYSKTCKGGTVKPEFLRTGEVVARADPARFNRLSVAVMDHLSENGTEKFCALMDAYFKPQSIQ